MKPLLQADGLDRLRGFAQMQAGIVVKDMNPGVSGADPDIRNPTRVFVSQREPFTGAACPTAQLTSHPPSLTHLLIVHRESEPFRHLCFYVIELYYPSVHPQDSLTWPPWDVDLNSNARQASIAPALYHSRVSYGIGANMDTSGVQSGVCTIPSRRWLEAQ